MTRRAKTIERKTVETLERENAQLRADVAATEALRESELKYRRLHESLRDAFVFVDLSGRIVEFNEAYRRMLGYEPEELLRLTYQELTPARWHPREAEIIERQVMTRDHSGVYEKEYRRKDGRVFPVELRTVLIRDPAGNAQGMWAIVRDITGRKQAEQAMRESESWLASALDIATLGLYRQQGPAEDRETFLDSRARALLGIPREQEFRTHLYWIEHVHPEDLPRVAEVSLGFESGGVDRAVVEYRFLRGPGDQVWIRHVAHAMERDAAGRAVLVMGILQDVTERRHAEDALRASEEQYRKLSARLITAQEAERSRLAGELHDDFSQRLALLAVNLHLLRQSLAGGSVAALASVDDLHHEVQALSKDMRRMSHDLHPARLEQLGLVSALKQLCDEVSDAHALQIAFAAQDVPLDLPELVALCFYRVAQEALQNIVKHSGADRATLSLRGCDAELCLTVCDDGRGFDPETAQRGDSLGLASIGERVRSIGGRFTIDSSPGRGTRIEVCTALSAGT